MSGWIKIERSLQDHWIWSDAVKLKCWVGILLNASHSNQKVLIGSEVIECRRGEIVGSLRDIASTLGVSKDYLRQFISILQKDFMVNSESSAKYTRITICNYDSYQGSLHDEKTIQRQTEDSKKNVKNEKKSIIDKKAKDLEPTSIVDKFNIFWEVYNKKESRATALKSWHKLSPEEMDKVLETVSSYVLWKSDPNYRKLPATYLNQKCFNDEIPSIFATPIKKETTTYQPPANAIF